MLRSIVLSLLSLLLLSACTPSVPTHSTPAGRQPSIMPDYVDVTVPCNIAPLNFALNEPCREVVARLSTDQCSVVCGQGMQVIIDAAEWQRLVQSAVGDDIRVELFARQPDGQWLAYDTFCIHVAPDSIDAYITYRLIPPSYVAYEELIIEQRCLEDFTTRVVYDNMKVSTEQQGQCINCHSFQNYRTDRFLFHIRQAWGGTVIVNDGKVSKVNLKRPGCLSAGVYPAWHPTLPLIAFSTNVTAQVFHTTDTAKVEVFDAASDVILYDVMQDTVTAVSCDTAQMETFPTWSPDGRWLYYCSAATPYDIHADDVSAEAVAHYTDIRYDLWRRSFDPDTRQFGPAELVYEAAADSLSVTLPRLSPDGRWLVCSVAPYGCFHVWHPEADIMLIDLQCTDMVSADGDIPEQRYTARTLREMSSDCSDSYPSFSSNGRWLMCASRRDDGNYTRPYIAYFDRDGRCHKPFEVPQLSPAFYQLSFKSFNRPEFTITPVSTTVEDFARLCTDD